jgi:superfamily II DNA or RNA helicase
LIGKSRYFDAFGYAWQKAALELFRSELFGNFSGTGAGKTLSAILSSRIVDSKMTVIICPNAVVDQWAIDIKKTFPDSLITTRKDAFDEKYDENKHKY